MTIDKAIALSCIALACVVAQAAQPTLRTLPADGVPLDAQMRAQLMSDAVEFSDRPRPATPIPTIVALPPDVFAQEVCRDDNIPCDSVLAAYDPKRLRVMYRASLDLSKVWERSFLVHELVHWLQHQAKPESHADASCPDFKAAEREAYAVQNRFLRHHQSGRRAGTMLNMLHC